MKKEMFNENEMQYLAQNYAIACQNRYSGTFNDWYNNLPEDWKKIANAVGAPKMLKSPDISALKSMASYYIKKLSNNEIAGVDTQYYFEAVIEAFYGKEVWDWINEHLD